MGNFYTGKGDDGTTGTLGSCRMNKDSALACALGDMDELNSVIGITITNTTDETISKMLKGIQNKLFTASAELASTAEGAGLKSRITENDVKDIEREIDSIEATLPKQTKFVLPGGSAQGAYVHLARSIARRAERSVIAFSKEQKVAEPVLKYMNRVSSLLFAAALDANRKEGIEEDNPVYG